MTIFSGVEAYVADRGGRRAIKKVLIANNGIGAVKAIRSVRRWCYEMLGNEKAITFVVMATPEDMRANAEYIRMADEIVDVPGGSNNNNYANVMLIVEIAERWGVDAVWAGWGHASENPLLPNSLASSPRKIAFLGPPGKPMKALGDKIGSTIIAQSAGVPCISWNGDDLMIEYDGEGGVPQDVYDQADVKTAAQALEVCEKVGYPLMIKASEGGGGKGIRMVAASKDVETSYRQVAGEVPGSPIFVMKLAPRSRHLEVQLLADEYGEAIALNGRDCSVQRRHQKIIEEGPPVAASPDVWRSMEQAAVSLAKSVGYVNAGTVEYLYQEEDHKFFFLELNPRLQVEHPVTEMITKVNLPAAQLQVAMGIPLHMIPDVRRFYGEDPFGREGIDFSTRTPIVPEAHCIAVRITAENPDQGFRPTSGAIQELNFRSTPSVWGYFSVDSSGQVHEFADSQFGHLFASGADRQAARKNMILALKELSIRGDIRTTIEYIGDMMESDDFVNNNISTAWLDARIKSGSVGKAPPPSINAHLAVVIGGAIEAHNQSLKRQETFSSLVLKGLLPPPRHLLDISVDVELVHAGVKYMLRCSQSGPKTFTVACNDAYVQADCRTLADGGCLVVVGGRSYVVYTQVEPSGTRLSINGTTVSFTRDYDPSRLDADVAGKLTRCLVADGDHIKAGEAYAEIEVMKMCMPLKVKETGVILWMLSEGAALKPGDQLAQLTLDDPSSVKMVRILLSLPGLAVCYALTDRCYVPSGLSVCRRLRAPGGDCLFAHDEQAPPPTAIQYPGAGDDDGGIPRTPPSVRRRPEGPQGFCLQPSFAPSRV
jgi:acetyl-CoA carboxylase/biotin carboxylase 1